MMHMFGAQAAIEFHQSAAKKTHKELARSDVFGKESVKAVKAEDAIEADIKAEIAAAQEIYLKMDV